MALLPPTFILPASLATWFRRAAEDSDSSVDIGGARLRPTAIGEGQVTLVLEDLDAEEDSEGRDVSHLGTVFLDPHGRDIYLAPWYYKTDNAQDLTVREFLEAYAGAEARAAELSSAVNEIGTLRSQVRLWQVLCGLSVVAWFVIAR